MEQSVTIRIAGKEFPLKATSPEIEQMMRLAAEHINQKLAEYDSRYPDKALADKLAFVALNETVTKISFRRRLEALEDEIRKMTGETDSYLDKLKEQ